mmetsp:Transcript_16257/g.38404  ORF Transcript_16257/g.38404 Transcript_16257/m.38404 type:complete len:265 (-) Transcript_16257:176-970(-)
MQDLGWHRVGVREAVHDVAVRLICPRVLLHDVLHLPDAFALIDDILVDDHVLDIAVNLVQKHEVSVDGKEDHATCETEVDLLRHMLLKDVAAGISDQEKRGHSHEAHGFGIPPLMSALRDVVEPVFDGALLPEEHGLAQVLHKPVDGRADDRNGSQARQGLRARIDVCLEDCFIHGIGPVVVQDHRAGYTDHKSDKQSQVCWRVKGILKVKGVGLGEFRDPWHGATQSDAKGVHTIVDGGPEALELPAWGSFQDRCRFRAPPIL